MQVPSVIRIASITACVSIIALAAVTVYGIKIFTILCLEKEEDHFMLNVKKRDGTIVPFDLNKITTAIEKAFIAEHKVYTQELIERLALRVTSDFNSKVVDDTVTVEQVQDSVENVLVATGYVDVAKAYILYRKLHEL